jgi:hypothetical protein
MTRTTTERKHRHRNEAFGVLALLAALVGLGVLGTRGGGPTARPDPFRDAARAMLRDAPGAVETCCDSLALTVGDGSARDAEDLEAFTVLLGSLGFSDATLSRMANTRALDGMQTAESDHAVMWWTFHPDDGMTVIIEPAG